MSIVIGYVHEINENGKKNKYLILGADTRVTTYYNFYRETKKDCLIKFIGISPQIIIGFVSDNLDELKKKINGVNQEFSYAEKSKLKLDELRSILRKENLKSSFIIGDGENKKMYKWTFENHFKEEEIDRFDLIGFCDEKNELKDRLSEKVEEISQSNLEMSHLEIISAIKSTWERRYDDLLKKIDENSFYCGRDLIFASSNSNGTFLLTESKSVSVSYGDNNVKTSQQKVKNDQLNEINAEIIYNSEYVVKIENILKWEPELKSKS